MAQSGLIRGNRHDCKGTPNLSLGDAEVIPDHYIVVFDDDVADVQEVAAELARASGASVRFIYTDALKGFAAYIPADGLSRVANDSRVKYVEPDQAAESNLDGAIIERPRDP